MSTSIRAMLEADLAAIGMSQEQFGERLGVTQQTISSWGARNSIPAARRQEVVDILGGESETAKYVIATESISDMGIRMAVSMDARRRAAQPPPR